MNYFIKIFARSKRWLKIQSCIKNRYIKSVQSSDELKLEVKKQLIKNKASGDSTPIHILFNDKNILHEVVVFKNPQGQFESVVKKVS